MPKGGENGKQRVAKPPGKKAQGQATKRQKGSERASNRAVRNYTRGANNLLVAGVVIAALGGGRFHVITETGEEHKSIGMRKGLKLPKKAVRGYARTTISPGSFVIIDGGRIGGVLTGEDERRLQETMKMRVGALSRVSNNAKTKAAATAALERMERLNALGVGVAPAGFTYSSSSSGTRRSKSSSKSSSKSGSGTRKAAHKAKKAEGRRARVLAQAANKAAAGINLYAAANRANRAAEREALAGIAAAAPLPKEKDPSKPMTFSEFLKAQKKAGLRNNNGLGNFMSRGQATGALEE